MPYGKGTYGSKVGRPTKKAKRATKKIKKVQGLVEKGKMKRGTRVAARYDKKARKKK
tara:strand:- start:34 stop:204 length:171 start_codon:yes stop_codon:yes gene_type:complete